MKVSDYVKKCVENYIEMSSGKISKLRVLIHYTKDREYGFVQINGAIYIPNSKDIPFDGVFMRSSDLVDGWEEFDSTELKLPFVEKIIVAIKDK